MATAVIWLCWEATQLAVGRLEGALHGSGMAMREQQPAVVANDGEFDQLEWH